MSEFTLDHLTGVEFEEFVFDLLTAMGFVNVRWRKGTGFGSSPADHNRDIECELVRNDVDGTLISERWFVECKHYQQGVPPAKIQDALAWAEAARPDVLLLVASTSFPRAPTTIWTSTVTPERLPSESSAGRSQR